MTNPTDLLDAIVTSLRAIPELVTLLAGDGANIVAYKHQWPSATSWMLALRQQKAGGIMVLYRGTGIAQWGRIPSRAHNFSLLVRDGEGVDVCAIWTAIIDGGFRSAADIHADVDMVQDPSFELRTIAVTETAYLDYWEAQFALTEKFAG